MKRLAAEGQKETGGGTLEMVFDPVNFTRTLLLSSLETNRHYDGQCPTEVSDSIAFNVFDWPVKANTKSFRE